MKLVPVPASEPTLATAKRTTSGRGGTFTNNPASGRLLLTEVLMPLCDVCKMGFTLSGKECPECGEIVKSARRTEYRGRKALTPYTAGELVESDDEIHLQELKGSDYELPGTSSSLSLVASDPRVPAPIAERDSELLLPRQLPKPIDGIKARKRTDAPRPA